MIVLKTKLEKKFQKEEKRKKRKNLNLDELKGRRKSNHSYIFKPPALWHFQVASDSDQEIFKKAAQPICDAYKQAIELAHQGTHVISTDESPLA